MLVCNKKFLGSFDHCFVVILVPSIVALLKDENRLKQKLTKPDTILMLFFIILLYLLLDSQSEAFFRGGCGGKSVVLPKRWGVAPKHLDQSHQRAAGSVQDEFTIDPLVDVILMAGIERKAKSFTVLNLVDSNIADYFIILEGGSKPHISALADIVEVRV